VSKARLVITDVVVEGRSQSEVAREYGVSQGWISRLVKRYRLEGAAAFQPRSGRPHTSPTRLPPATIDLIVELREDLAAKGLDHLAHTIAWHLQHHHRLVVSPASIHRHLRAAGLITPTPQKRPKSSYTRFAAEQPNERCDIRSMYSKRVAVIPCSTATLANGGISVACTASNTSSFIRPCPSR
jgi:transposase